MEKNIFKDKLQYDKIFMKDIWINYFETRAIRENIARIKFENLYLGSTEIHGSPIYSHMEILDVFKKYTYSNEPLAKKIVSEFFSQIKQNNTYAILEEYLYTLADKSTEKEMDEFLRAHNLKNYFSNIKAKIQWTKSKIFAEGRGERGTIRRGENKSG